ETTRAGRIGISWMILTLAGAAATAFVGVGYFQQNPDAVLRDPEAVFIQMGQVLFHPFIAGVLLAAVLAAIMSTVSSQLIVTSSALVEDIYKAVYKTDAQDKHYILLGRIAVDRKSTRLNSSHVKISYAVFCLKKKKKVKTHTQ